MNIYLTLYLVNIEVNTYLMHIEVKEAPTSQLWDHLSIAKNNEYNWLKYIV